MNTHTFTIRPLTSVRRKPRHVLESLLLRLLLLALAWMLVYLPMRKIHAAMGVVDKPLTFMKKLPNTDPIPLTFPDPCWKLSGRDTEYKNAILCDFQSRLAKIGVPFAERRYYAAQLYQENGAFTPERLGDKGCSFGLIQYNACAKNGMSAKAFLRKHPEWKTVDKQLAWMVEQIRWRREEFDSVRLRILAHNCPACARRRAWDSRADYVSNVLDKSDLFALL